MTRRPNRVGPKALFALPLWTLAIAVAAAQEPPAAPDSAWVLLSSETEYDANARTCLSSAANPPYPVAMARCWDNPPDPAQLYTFDGQGRLIRKKDGSCLDPENYDAAAGAAVFLSPCDGQEDQRWTLHSLGGGAFELRNRKSGRCLDPVASSWGSKIKLGHACGFPDQRWTFRSYDGRTPEQLLQAFVSQPSQTPAPAPPPPPPPRARIGPDNALVLGGGAGARCLAVVDPSLPSVRVDLAPCTPRTHTQRWRLDGDRILSAWSGQGRCLELANPGDATSLRLAPCSGAAAQRFVRPALPDGRMILANSGRCLGGPSGALQIVECGGGTQADLAYPLWRGEPATHGVMLTSSLAVGRGLRESCSAGVCSVRMDPLSPDQKSAFMFDLAPGLAGGGSVSLRAQADPARYLVVADGALALTRDPAAAAASFWLTEGLSDVKLRSLESVVKPGHYVRVRAGGQITVEPLGGVDSFAEATLDIVAIEDPPPYQAAAPVNFFELRSEAVPSCLGAGGLVSCCAPARFGLNERGDILEEKGRQCLETFSGAGGTPAARLATCNGTSAQTWQWLEREPDRWAVRNAASNTCLRATPKGTELGSCEDKPAVWNRSPRMSESPPGDRVIIRNTRYPVQLGVSRGSTPVFDTFGSKLPTTWSFQPTGRGSYYLRVGSGGKLLEPDGVGGLRLADQAPMCSEAQEWELHRSTSPLDDLPRGAVVITNRATREVLTVANGARLTARQAPVTPDQMFRLSPWTADLELAQRFAPVLRFDTRQKGFPMAAQDYWERLQANDKRLLDPALGERAPGIENASPDSRAPTYVQVVRHPRSGQVRIHYWWFYGLQHACNTKLDSEDSGRHHGDWEHVTVILRADRQAVAAVTFYQHNGQYTRIAGPRDAPCTPEINVSGRCAGSQGFSVDGLRPVVFVGQLSHGSFHAGSGGAHGKDLLSCSYWEDRRLPGTARPTMTAHYLVDLTLDEEDWMIADRAKAVRWGPTDDSQGSRGEGGVATQPTMKLPTFTDRACDGTPIYSIKDAGCFMSECLAGDDETLGNCLKECEPGYTNLGHMCSKWSKTYGRRSYGYNYVIPWSDAGLSRRRSGQAEWSLP